MITPALYILANFATFILLVCLMQAGWRDSHWLFRAGAVMIAAGCFATAVSPLAGVYIIGVPHLIKSIGLLIVVSMMRYRQIAHLPRDQRLRTCP